MLRQVKPALIIFVLLTLLTGVVYPLLVTGVAQIVFPYQANGSLVKNGGKILGSVLIGQDFSSSRYFWGRVSATSGEPYTAFDPAVQAGSSGSNLGPLSQTLNDDVQARVEILQKANGGDSSIIPADLVTSSASGLDPQISPQAANYQIARVAKSRGLDEKTVKDLVAELTEERQFGILGEPCVNVLLLNLALDGIQ
jgi:K+-transporting ATPase ATPase C chain